jgi:D-alanyl-D-alanine dipeptidase
MMNNHIIKSGFVLFCSCLLLSCASKPPFEKGIFKTSDLVELTAVDPTLKLDIRYATRNNFVGKPVYTEARAFLQRPAAQAVAKVNAELEPLGYGLLIFDGYRPWSVTKLFWDITPEDKKNFVADPKKGSRHNRGCAVDLTLYELATGQQVVMTSDYDEMNENAYPDYIGGTEKQRELRDLLREKMEANGFKVYKYEWWHFDFQGWEAYRIENIPFSEVK